MLNFKTSLSRILKQRDIDKVNKKIFKTFFKPS